MMEYRTKAAARDFCRQHDRVATLADQRSCVVAIRAEVEDKTRGWRQTLVAAR